MIKVYVQLNCACKLLPLLVLLLQLTSGERNVSLIIPVWHANPFPVTRGEPKYTFGHTHLNDNSDVAINVGGTDGRTKWFKRAT